MRMPPINVRKNHGIALVLVLWLLTLLTIMTMGFSATMRTESRLSAHEIGTARARALSQAGIWYGVRELLRSEPDQAWQRDGTAHLIRFGDGEITIRLNDEAGKIDLNTARSELLLGLLTSTEIGEQNALRLTEVIEDWRDRDNNRRPFGAEDEDYRNAGLGHGAKNGPFNSVGELRQVMGMKEEIFAQIAPALTVHSRRNAVNPAVAPQQALFAIPGMELSDVQAYLEARNRSTGDNDATPLSANRRLLSGSGGDTITISSTGSVETTRYTTEAVIFLKQNAQTPYSILSWAEAVPDLATE